MMTTERQLATIRRVDNLTPIEGADLIETAHFGGWAVVVKKNTFSVGDLAVYCEIDSFVPNSIAPFLTKEGRDCHEFNGVLGERIRTIKLRGQVSQGLAFPVQSVVATGNELGALCDAVGQILKDEFDDSILVKEGDDVTEILGIQKWEKPMSPQIAAVAKGNFPSFIPKTDQTRVQNIRDLHKYYGQVFEVTEKLDGSSCTMFIDKDGEFHVCSRNIDLKYEPGNYFWAVAEKYDIEKKLRELVFPYALQGELVGPNIQGNTLKLTEHQFTIFDIYDFGLGKYLAPANRQEVIQHLGLQSVPVLKKYTLTESDNSKTLVESADGFSVYSELSSKTLREGLVFKSMDGLTSFKAISNKWLLKNEA